MVEDEDMIRTLIRKILAGSGYTVLTAGDGEQALDVGRQHKGPIHLVITDVVMPRMGGKDLAETLSEVLPATKILFMSGYTDAAIVSSGILEREVAFLQKPFTPGALVQRVRSVLDSGKTHTAAE